MNDRSEVLWLENQICFSLYTVSRLVTQFYTPLLNKLDITYPQYLVLLVLWKEDHRSVSDISKLLYLESNTLTPLLKRMEKKGLINRKRSVTDERRVEVSLTEKGIAFKEDAVCIPHKIIEKMGSGTMTKAEALQLKSTLGKMMDMFTEEKENNAVQ